MHDDLLVEEKIAASIDRLWGALFHNHDFTDSAILEPLVTAAVPEVTKHYLKGQ